jgi:hypothetical protein
LSCVFWVFELLLKISNLFHFLGLFWLFSVFEILFFYYYFLNCGVWLFVANLICGFVFVFVRVNLCVIRFIWGVVDVELDCKVLCVELGFFFFFWEHFAKIQLFLWGVGSVVVGLNGDH